MTTINEKLEILKALIEAPFPHNTWTYENKIRLSGTRNIQDFCDNVLPKVPLELQRRISYSARIGFLVFEGIADSMNKMKEERTVTLDLTNLKLPLDFPGFRLYKGTLEIHGNVGRMAGLRMKDKGKLIIHGDTGHSLGTFMESNARIDVYGKAGHSVGYESGGGEIYLHNGYLSTAYPKSTILPPQLITGAKIYHKEGSKWNQIAP